MPLESEPDGRSVYTLLSNVWDPRTTQFDKYSVPDFGQRFALYGYGFDYMNTVIDYLYRIYAATRPGRQEPNLETIGEIIDTITDISRMLGIYYTALTMKQSRDPLMFKRAEQTNMRDTFVEMQTMLLDLPCPPMIAQLNAKYVRLMDVSSDRMYQNVGFLVAGDYDAFLTLNDNVRRRRNAISFMRHGLEYPNLGSLGDPGSAYNADVLQAFSNCNVKYESGNPFAVYVTVDGATEEPSALASAGVLHVTWDQTPGRAAIYTQSGFALPGTGLGAIGAVRSAIPYICTWDKVNETDSAISLTVNRAIPSLGATHSPCATANIDLAANIAHEFNMASSETESNFYVDEFTPGDPLVITRELLASTNTRYRVSAGFGLQKLSYSFSSNNMAFLAGLLDGGNRI
jgi:hypothetical protein